MSGPAGSRGRPRLVVLGCGFGGYSLLTRLDLERWDATLVAPRNYFLFYPLLASATVGTVELRSILEPVPRRLRPLAVVQAEADRIDFTAREVVCRAAVGGETFGVGYDLLVVAIGARVADYGVPGVAEHALKLRSVEDARAIRKGLLDRFAEAGVPGTSPDEVRRRLTFVVCGGGPTGVEVAAEITDLVHREIARDAPALAAPARVVLVEATDRLLTGFDEALAGYAREHFLSEGIEVRTSAKVVEVAPREVKLAGGESIRCGLVIWAGGNAPAPLVEGLDLPKNSQGRLLTDRTLRLPDHPEVFAIGDCAVPEDLPLPATAQVAQQQGKHLAKQLARLRRGLEPKPFDFRSAGMLAYVGGGRALADLPHVRWTGRAAWVLWRSVYLTKLVSLANKVKVLFDWGKNRVFGRDVSRF